MPAPPANTPLILAAGVSADGTSFAVIRYLEADGSRDTSWGTGGLVNTSFGVGFTALALGVAVQTDGKVIAVGQAVDGNTGNTYFAIARYNTDGSLDTTGFGTGGLFTTSFGVSDQAALATSVAVQGDGKIVVAGIQGGGTPGWGLIRLTTAGALDSGFGTGGKVVLATDGAGDSFNTARALAIQGDGKIVAAGDAGQVVTNKGLFAVARYNTDGSLDTTGFGTGGVVTTSFSANNDQANAVAIQADGKIVAAGYTGNGASPVTFAVARYTTAGVLDAAGFGTGGKASFGFGTSGETDAEAQGVAVQTSDQKIVVTGFANGAATQTALARLKTDGTLDTLTFGILGKVTTTFAGVTPGSLGGMLLQAADVRPVVTAGTTGGGAACVARYLTTGAPDNSWGTMSLVTDAGASSLFALAQQTITPAATSTLSGTVTDSATGLPLGSWAVALGGDLTGATATDASGHYSFVEGVTGGQSYAVTITVTPQGGYTAASANPATVNFTGGDDATRNFSFTPEPRISAGGVAGGIQISWTDLVLGRRVRKL